MRDVYRTPYAGSWYPGHAAELRDLLSELFVESEQRTGWWVRPGALAFLVPHAGLMYSGAVAAAAYRHIARQKPRVAVILGFLHARRHAGIAMAAPDSYCTPLGEVPVDQATVNLLAERDVFHRAPAAVFSDHSVEIQLPLLQWAWADVAVVPLYVGELNVGERELAAGALAALPPDTVLIASSDLTHYGPDFRYEPFPPDTRVDANLRRLDFGALEAASTLDPDEFAAELCRTGATVCGRGPIKLLLETMRKKAAPEIYQHVLDYRSSREITAGGGSSVSYGAAGYFPADAFALPEDEASALLDAAQSSLHEYSQSGRRTAREPGNPEAGNFGAPGVFVCVKREGRPRGCVGRIGGKIPLRTCVPELALSAALDDQRFTPLPRSEYARLEIELCVLTPLKPVVSPESFQLGLHGAMLELDECSGLLLPQVGRRPHWTSERFLRALSVKAGLGEDDWRGTGARLSVFQAFTHDRNPL